jgi:uncharacterized protein (TIGR01777 family)
MRVVIAGGTGFLGRALARSLAADGHDVVVLTRRPEHRQSAIDSGATSGTARMIEWTPNGKSGPWASAIDGADAVVNLAGESIAGKRWTAEQERRILDSRVQATRSLAVAIQASGNPPPVFVSGSAVGYYGPLGDDIATEDTPPGSDFLARVCVTWEEEARRAATPRTRVTCIRTGLVLAKDGGALPPMLTPFRFGAGGPAGSGRQYWSWIHRHDWVDLVRWAMRALDAGGAVNATAPNPVTNAEFARALGRAMHRPALIPAPAFALRLLLGEMAVPLVLSGQRAVPRRAERGGFTFTYRTVDDALQAIFRQA